MKKYLYIIVLIATTAYGQQDTIVNQLEDVVLPDVYAKEKSVGLKQLKLSDSIINNNTENTTQLLRYNSAIYFKENGFGMVSSPSFRGTNASHTATIWNGINVNSPLNGQTDFNALQVNTFDQVQVRSGGGSIKYGSGAIGGTVHLNNNLSFKKHLTNQVIASYGSFDTWNATYKSNYGSDKFALNGGFNYRSSDNDYKYLGFDKNNENGAYDSWSPSIAFAFKLHQFHQLSFFTTAYKGSRLLSGTVTAPSNDKYDDEHFRGLVNWSFKKNRLHSQLKLAFLQEQYRYFDNAEIDQFSFGKANTILTNYDAEFKVNNVLKLQSVTEFNTISGEGTNIEKERRNQFSQAIVLDHQPLEKIHYQIKFRKDFYKNYNAPILYAIGASYQFTPSSSILANGSKNFKIPTFNDLYWEDLGNINLKPEETYQVELGYQLNKFGAVLDVRGFYIDAKDLIKWAPQASGVWRPFNISHLKNYGIEMTLNWNKQFKYHNFSFDANYAYTKSIDQETDLQSIYVPEHLFNCTIGYSFKKWSVFYQTLLNGEVYVTSDNETSIDAFDVVNIGINYLFIQKEKSSLNIGLKANNIYNEIYENVASRPMPNRNFNLNINYKF